MFVKDLRKCELQPKSVRARVYADRLGSRTQRGLKKFFT